MKTTRGMQRRSAKLARRAEIVDGETLIAGIDLAKRESVVLFTRNRDRARLGTLRIPTSAGGVVELQRRAVDLQSRHGLPRLVLGMEPTGHYWKIVAKAARDLNLPYVLVQSFTLARSREFDDLTRDKTDLRDAGLIADLVAERRFTEVQLQTGVWAELRLYAEAREQRCTERSAGLHEQRALLEWVWPALLERVPDLSGCHLQATLRLGLTPVEIGGLSRAQFTKRLRGEQRGRRFLIGMAKRIWEAAPLTAAGDELAATVLRWQLAGQRIQLAEQAIATLESRMATAFESTELAWLRGQIRGLGDVLLITLLALTGDPRRFDDSGCLPKLAGSSPTERSSGESTAAGGIHRRGRRTLRLAAYQAAHCLVRHNPDFGRRYVALVQRPHQPLKKKPAMVAIANKLLRTLWAMAVNGQPYDSAVARGEVRAQACAA